MYKREVIDSSYPTIEHPHVFGSVVVGILLCTGGLLIAMGSSLRDIAPPFWLFLMSLAAWWAAAYLLRRLEVWYYRRRYRVELSDQVSVLDNRPLTTALGDGLIVGYILLSLFLAANDIHPQVSLTGLLISSLFLLGYLEPPRISMYWLILVVLIVFLSLLPLAGVGGSSDTGFLRMPVEGVILAVLGVVLLVWGVYAHLDLARRLGHRDAAR